VHVLIIGGTRFIGSLLAWRLVAGGHRVTLLNRGTRGDGFGDRVERIVANRSTPALGEAVAGRRFDAVVDFAAYVGADAERSIAAFGNRVEHYVWVSSGQVYLVREPRPALAREVDYAGAVMARPEAATDAAEWDYGVGKRGCEDAFATAHAERGFPVTTLRLPMVNGERDYHRRVEGYLWRLVDGGTLLLPGGGDAPMRHVYGDDVARCVVELLGRAETFGQSFNLAQAETPTLRELLGLLADRVGRTGGTAQRPLELVAVSRERLQAAELNAVEVSPFSDAWMSFVDPSRAVAELGFHHRPLAAYLDSIVASFMAHPPPAPPPAYARRADELALARELA
jgi:nucleoside-diphosphate-sugar epimerase